MNYYLPISIDTRRVHICKLSDSSEKSTFGFIFGGRTLFNTFDEGGNELICEDGQNVDLRGYEFECFTEKSNIPLSNVYVFNIVKKEKGRKRTIPDDFPFTITRESDFCNRGVKVDFKESRRNMMQDFRVCIRYESGENDNKTVNNYYFRGYASDYRHVVDAVIDFGSEASQIHVGGPKDADSDLVGLFRSFYDDYHLKDCRKGFWQSDDKNYLYKSTYFIHKNAKMVKFGDEPNNHGENTFVRYLVGIDQNQDFFKNYIQSSNLKLFDIMSPNTAAVLGSVSVAEGSEIYHNNDGVGSFGDVQFRKDLLHAILGGFLHCVIKKSASRLDNEKQYLNLVLLVPNVYDQEKVYDIIEGMYNDFSKISQNKFTGIEVSVISESDASFLGALRRNNREITEATGFGGGYFLIVDAGKGTTDFSVMQAKVDENGANPTRWNSLFRGGLPASGQALTYAIYEAVYAFFKNNCDLDLDVFFRDDKDVSLVHKRAFMNALDEIKIKFEHLTEVDDNAITVGKIPSTLEGVNNILTHMIKEGKMMRGTKKLLEEKVEIICNLIAKKIKENMVGIDADAKFCKVLLTGRAFMFNMFKNGLMDSLRDVELIGSDEVLFSPYDEEVLKKVCIEGALTLNNRPINNNSELICRPIVTRFDGGQVNNKPRGMKNETFGERINPARFIMRTIKKLGQKDDNVDVPTDEVFLYCGDEVDNEVVSNVQVGLERFQLEDLDHVYFVGDELLYKDKDGNRLNDRYLAGLQLDNEISTLIKESLFPYHPDSIPAAGTHDVKVQKQANTTGNTSGGAAPKPEQPSTNGTQGTQSNNGENYPKKNEDSDDWYDDTRKNSDNAVTDFNLLN